MSANFAISQFLSKPSPKRAKDVICLLKFKRQERICARKFGDDEDYEDFMYVGSSEDYVGSSESDSRGNMSDFDCYDN